MPPVPPDTTASLPEATRPRAARGRWLDRAPGIRAQGALLLAAVLSGLAPRDRYTWALELTVLGVVFGSTWVWSRRYPHLRPTPPLAWLLWLYGFVMLAGAHATYAHAWPGEWLRSLLQLERNPWDRVGHLFQGALPALFARETLRRVGWRGARLALAALAAGLLVSLAFEGLEQIAAHFAVDAAAFVQAQGDPFDSLFDVLFAGAGAVAALAFFGRLQDAQLLRQATEGSTWCVSTMVWGNPPTEVPSGLQADCSQTLRPTRVAQTPRAPVA